MNLDPEYKVSLKVIDYENRILIAKCELKDK